MKTLLVCAVLACVTFGSAQAQQPKALELMRLLWETESYPRLYSVAETYFGPGATSASAYREYTTEVVTEEGEVFYTEWEMEQVSKGAFIKNLSFKMTGNATTDLFKYTSGYFVGLLATACFSSSEEEMANLGGWFNERMTAALEQGGGKAAVSFGDTSFEFELAYHLDGFYRLRHTFWRDSRPEGGLGKHCTFEKPMLNN